MEHITRYYVRTKGGLRYRVEYVNRRDNGAPDIIRVISLKTDIIREITTGTARRHFGSTNKWVGYAIAQDIAGMY